MTFVDMAVLGFFAITFIGIAIAFERHMAGKDE